MSVGFPSLVMWPTRSRTRGGVRSLDRWVVDSRGRERWFPGRVLSPAPDPKGYLTVTLVTRGSGAPRSSVRVHLLVLEAFVGPCPAGLQALHADDVKSHNALVNLRWGTPSENQHDSVRNGTHRWSA